MFFKENTILAIEYTGNALRGIVLGKNGGSAVLKGADEITVQTQDSLPRSEDIKTLLQQLGEYPEQAVFIIPSVRFLCSELPIPADVKMSSEKLGEAIGWEVEPYLGFPASDGFFSYQRQNIHAGQSEGTTSFFITALLKTEYSVIQKACQKCGLKLKGVYGRENACAFSMSPSTEPIILLNTDSASVTGAVMNGNGPIAFQTAPCDAVEMLVSDLARKTENVGEIIVSGNVDSVSSIIDKIREKVSCPVKVWNTGKYIRHADKIPDDALGPHYVGVIGAALQETKAVMGKQLRISSVVPLSMRIKKLFKFIPFTVLGIMLVGFAAHYGYMQSAMHYYSTNTAKLQMRKKNLERKISVLNDLKKQIMDIKKEKKYIAGLPLRNKRLAGFIAGIVTQIPPDVTLNKISQENRTVFLIEGWGVSATSITVFTKSLDNLDVTKEATLDVILETTGNTNEEMFRYQFKIKVLLK